MATLIIPVIYDMVGVSRDASVKRTVQLWNQSYMDAYTADTANMSAYTDWNSASSRLATGVTVSLGNDTVTFACQKPNLDGETFTFVVGRGVVLGP